MKKFKLAFFTLLFACSLFAVSPVKADPGMPGGNADPDAPGLPIDTHIWVLAAAGALAGFVSTYKAGKKVGPSNNT